MIEFLFEIDYKKNMILANSWKIIKLIYWFCHIPCFLFQAWYLIFGFFIITPSKQASGILIHSCLLPACAPHHHHHHHRDLLSPGWKYIFSIILSISCWSVNLVTSIGRTVFSISMQNLYLTLFLKKFTFWWVLQLSRYKRQNAKKENTE